MTTRRIEITVGIFVALGLAALFMLAIQVSNLGEYRGGDGYEVHAYFNNIGGLKVRAPVTMAGVRVGRVSAITYDAERYQARVSFTISARYDQLPTDTQASIYTAGLLGEQYIALEPGGEDEVLRDGDAILFTQSALVLEELIGRVLVNLTGN
ncbi:outer membrane lipid asymmetry maintenance protein MlaD [Ectothiorhodospira shaposhnikovii]|uniref:outer membrane lipid asymmetry maintenance protein MlaD n=1 Tax=Ectothiorhodospira shaposhnikovii TaxID=1054 RepID=UPI001904F95C|nr:outer membrane lipid asymmetry maintenance protein MlaD [Ectothiorhodospira shaposhnikovii]MBK1672521.1 outer membrane lipid asymmetry maintenance protein MlaD [Ectothiorhodospira shaposhnikovii]